MQNMNDKLIELVDTLSTLKARRATQCEYLKAYEAYRAGINLIGKHNGRNIYTQYEQGMISGVYRGFMLTLDTVYAYEYKGQLYTTNKKVPECMLSTDELHKKSLTTGEWAALPKGLYYRTGELYFRG